MRFIITGPTGKRIEFAIHVQYDDGCEHLDSDDERDRYNIANGVVGNFRRLAAELGLTMDMEEDGPVSRP